MKSGLLFTRKIFIQLMLVLVVAVILNFLSVLPVEKNEDDEHYTIREQRWIKKFNDAYMAWDELKMEREEVLENFVTNYCGEIIQLGDGSQGIVGFTR